MTAGKLDLAHNLLSDEDYSEKRLAFDENGIKIWAALGTYFDVQGLDTERRFRLIEKGQVIEKSFMKSAILELAGTRQIADMNGFAVVNGLAMIGGGKHEIHRAPGAGRCEGDESGI